MPYGIIEPSGCCESKGRVQVRFSLFLNPGEKGYNEHYLRIPILPEGGYPEANPSPDLDLTKEEMDAHNATYEAWLGSLPTKWVAVPFHEHLETFDANVTKAEIEQELIEVLDEFWASWQHNENILDGWVPRKQKTPRKERTPKRLADVEARVAHVKKIAKTLKREKTLRSTKRIG